MAIETLDEFVEAAGSERGFSLREASGVLQVIALECQPGAFLELYGAILQREAGDAADDATPELEALVKSNLHFLAMYTDGVRHSYGDRWAGTQLALAEHPLAHGQVTMFVHTIIGPPPYV